MKRERVALLVGSCLIGVVIVVTANSAVPQVVRIALGALLVFILPGFTLVCAVLPQREFSRGERLLASVGMSLAMAACAAVLLAATPLGLSRQSIAVVLGGSTVALSVVTGFRARLRKELRRHRESTSDGVVP